MSDKQNELEQRVANLEQATRRLRTAILVIPAVVLPLLLLGAVSDSQSVPGPLSATAFTVVDENGRRLAEFGQTSSHRPTLDVYNGDDPWNVLVQRKDGTVALSARDFYVWDQQRRNGANFGLSKSGLAGMWTKTDKKERTVFLQSSTDNINFYADDFWVQNAQGSTLAAVGTTKNKHGGLWVSAKTEIDPYVLDYLRDYGFKLTAQEARP